jgi:integrase
MKVAELRELEIIQEWFRSVRAKPHTQEGYLYCMQEYTDYVNMTPEELIEEAEEEYDARIKPRKMKLKVYITGFREHLEKKGLAPLSIENRITGVRSFYKANDIVIPELQRRESTARVKEEHKKIPNKEDIRKVLEKADPLEKAIILVGLSSGLAINEICELRISDFKNGYDSETGITTLDLRRRKKEVDFVTFLTPEATKAINDYLKFRGRIPKNGKEEYAIPLRKQRIVNDSGYLFIKRSIDDEYLETGNEELRKLQDFTIQEMYRILCVDAHMCAEKGVWNMFRSHNMRKYFNNRLIGAKTDTMIAEFLMGHKIRDRTRASYFVADPTELKEMYKDLVPFLTIEKPFDASDSEDFKRLEKKVSELESENETLSVERYELIKLREEIEKLKAEKKDMIDSYWESEAEHRDEKEVDQHFNEVEKEDLKKEIDELRGLVSMMLKSQGLDIDAPLTPEEKKAAKDAPDW